MWRQAAMVSAMVSAAAAVTASAPAWAGSIGDPICADRPGMNSATCSVPKGHWQIETGLADWTLSKIGGERDTELDLGASAIKYGVTDHLHVEVDVVPLARVTSRAAGVRSRSSGFGDVVLAVKQELGGGGPLRAALYPFVKLPTAKRGLGNGKVEGGVRLPLSLALGKSPFSLAATPEVDLNVDGDGHGRHLGMVQDVGLGLQATTRLNLTAEISAQWDWDPAGTVRQVSADLVAAFLTSRNVQLDGGVAVGLSRNAPDLELSAGVSARF